MANWTTYAPTLDWLSIGYIYLVILLAGLLMLWYLVVNLVRDARSLLREPAQRLRRCAMTYIITFGLIAFLMLGIPVAVSLGLSGLVGLLPRAGQPA